MARTSVCWKDRQPLIDPTTILPLPAGVVQPMPPRDNGDNFVGLRSKQAGVRQMNREESIWACVFVLGLWQPKTISLRV